MGRGAKLIGENMDRSVREIADPTRVVEVEMGRHDVANIAWAEAQIRDLPSAVSATSSPGRTIALNRNPSRRGSLTSSTPSPESTRIIPSSPSIKRQWQHMGAGDSGPPEPPNSFPPRGQRDPQLR